MKTILFNTHDLALLLVMCECLMLAILLVMIRKGKRLSNHLLAGFLLLNALIAFDILIYWSPLLNRLISSISPNLFFLFGFAYFLEGPVLYWYTKSIIYRDFSFRSIDIRHLIPALLYPAYIYGIYFRHDTPFKLELVNDYAALSANPWFQALLWLQKTVIVVYGALCLSQLVRYRGQLKHNYSNIEHIDFGWLKLLIGGFLTAWSWILVTMVTDQFAPAGISDCMGIIGNYFIFILINALVFYSLSHSDVFEGMQMRQADKKPDSGESIPPQYIERLERVMADEKPYLEPDITLEELAERLSISPRVLSTIINRHFQQNFFEFINHYRVERAKQLLAAEHTRNDTILDIMADAGFNSKSAFNRFFKKLAGITPSEYRRQHLS